MITNGYVIETKFRNGVDSNDPWIIYSAEDFLEKCDYYNSYDGIYRYYKFDDNLTEIDWGSLNTYITYFYGELDANNCHFTNLNKHYIFQYVGYGVNDGKISVLKNMKITYNGTGNSFVLYNYGTGSKYENIQIDGYMEGFQNMGVFVNYGYGRYWANSLEFVNCSSSVRLRQKTNQNAGVLLGHAYYNNMTIYLDTATYNGIKGTTMDLVKTGSWVSGVDYSRLYNGLSDSGYKVYLDGTELTSETEKKSNEGLGLDHVTYFETVTPSKSVTNGTYELTKSSNATKVYTTIKSQLTAYDEDGIMIQGQNGITNTHGSLENAFGDETTIQVLGKVENIVIKNERIESNNASYELNGTTLTIITNSTSNYQTGSISIGCTQYDENNKFVAYGELTIATKNGINDAWVIN